MSVLIKGVKMPDGAECWNCPCLDGEEGDCNALERKVYAGERPSDCPLIELPDHGDLIDRDAILGAYGTDVDVMFGFQGAKPVPLVKDIDVIHFIEGFEAVIPAERSEDGET